MPRSLFLLVALLLTVPALGQTPLPETYEWLAVPCDTWNCATSEMVLANGTPFVIVVPMMEGPHPWIVLRRVRSGSFHVPDDAPVVIDCFDQLPMASAHFDGKNGHSPMLLTLPDGRSGVVYLRNPPAKKRSARK